MGFNITILTHKLRKNFDMAEGAFVTMLDLSKSGSITQFKSPPNIKRCVFKAGKKIHWEKAHPPSPTLNITQFLLSIPKQWRQNTKTREPPMLKSCIYSRLCPMKSLLNIWSNIKNGHFRQHVNIYLNSLG